MLPPTDDPNGPKPTPPPGGRGDLILVIEDEADVRSMIQRLLEMRGYRTLAADSGQTGLALYQEHRAAVRAIITDLRMPSMHGTEVIDGLRGINPDARIVAMSGVLGQSLKLVEQPGRLVYLPKPMTSAELARALQSVTADPPV